MALQGVGIQVTLAFVFCTLGLSMREHVSASLYDELAAKGLNPRMRVTTQFDGEIQRAFVNRKFRSSLSIPTQWQDFMTAAHKFLGKGAFGKAYMMWTYAVPRVNLPLGTQIQVPIQGGYAPGQFHGFDTSGNVVLPNGTRLKPITVKYHSSQGWEPLALAHMEGPVVLKEQDIHPEQFGARWVDYYLESMLMYQVKSPYTMPVYAAYPTTDPGENYHSFWIMMPVMAGGESDSSLRKVFVKPSASRSAYDHAVNFLKIITFQGNQLGAENESAFVNHRHQKNYVLIPIFLDILYGIRDIHRAGIVHCDIKPANVLVSAKTCLENPADCHARVADFGVACSVTGQPRSCFNHRAGTIAYWPRETHFAGYSAQFPQDMWATGLTLFKIWTTALPGGLEEAAQTSFEECFNVLETFRVENHFERDMYPGLREAFSALLHPQPDRRDLTAAIRALETLHQEVRGVAYTPLTADPLPMHLGPLVECANRGCQYKCQLNGPGCICPDDMVLSRDGKSCQAKPGLVRRVAAQFWATITSSVEALMTVDEDFVYYYEDEGTEESESEEEGDDEES